MPNDTDQAGAAFATALDFAAHGLPVFPVRPPVDGRCPCHRPDCGDAGKHPFTEHGFKDAVTDERQLLHWNARWPDANWAMACGGAVVVDVDTKNGADPLEVIPEHDLTGPSVWTGEALEGSLEGERGTHVYRAPGCPTGRTPIDGVEVRGTGAYVILPGSRHVSGVPYEWASDARPWNVILEPVPEALVPKAKLTPVADGEIVDGTRNNTLASIAGKLRNCGLTEREIRAALLVVNHDRCRPPKPEDEVRGVAKSIARYELGGAPEEPLDEDDPLRNIPAVKYVAWLAPDGCPECGGELSIFKGTAWFCASCPPRQGAGRKHLGGGIYQLAALIGGYELPLRDGDYALLREMLTDGWVAKAEAA